jgi:hypothetical protein
MKYRVFCLFKATSCGNDIVARTAQKAAEKFMSGDDPALSPSLCHQCAHEIELGDVYALLLVGEDDKETTIEV